MRVSLTGRTAAVTGAIALQDFPTALMAGAKKKTEPPTCDCRRLSLEVATSNDSYAINQALKRSMAGSFSAPQNVESMGLDCAILSGAVDSTAARSGAMCL